MGFTRRLHHLACLLLLVAAPVSALDWDWWLGGPHEVSFGFDGYHLHRKRDGGTYQKGGIYGGHVSYERIRANALYWGAEGYYAAGTLEGSNASGSLALCSEFCEREIDGRIGWTFSCEADQEVLLSIFGGWSAYESVNCFVQPTPSPLHFRFRNRAFFFLAGTHLRVELSPHWIVGFRARALRLYDATQFISNDPAKGDQELQIGQETSTILEVPLTYDFEWGGLQIRAHAVPFYRLRFFGGHAGMYDFRPTKLISWGARAQLSCIF